MTMIQWATLALSIPTTLAYACRVGALDKRIHRASVIVLHLVAGIASLLATGQALEAPSPGAVLVLLATSIWIIVSYSDWRDGVPMWAARPRQSWVHSMRPLD
jgi:hypothetical protein